MKTLQIVEEQSYEYSGPIVECKGGGGGSSGAVEYPDYIEEIQCGWLNGVVVHAGTSLTVSNDITSIMDAALGNSPWTGLTAYNPDADIITYEAAIAAFAALLVGIVDTTNWAALYAQAVTSVGAYVDLAVADEVVADLGAIGDLTVIDGVVGDMVAVPDTAVANAPAVADVAGVAGITEALIVADVNNFADQLDDEIDTKVLPAFRRGMQDINAVVSASFPIGESIIYAFRDREVAKHASTLRLNAADKNADIELSVGTTNVNKNIQVASINLNKDVQVALANLSKDVQVSSGNLNKDVEVVRVNISKDSQVGATNVNKNVQISTGDMRKNLELGIANLNKSLQLSTTNVTKDTEIVKSNLLKNVQVGTTNLTKDVDIGKSNLAKSTQVGLANLNKDVEIGNINARSTTEYKRIYTDGAGQILHLMLQRVAWQESLMRTIIEGKRIKIVAKAEEVNRNAALDEEDALWDLEVFQYGANLMAGAAGGTATTKTRATNATGASMLGGALSGAAAGAMIGSAVPGIGTVAGAIGGAVVGGAAAYMSQ